MNLPTPEGSSRSEEVLSASMAPVIVDMHCHVDFDPDPASFALACSGQGLALCSSTVTPRGYEQARKVLKDQANVCVGVGLHPWWLVDGSCGAEDVDLLEALMASTSLVGEVGLDFSDACLARACVDEVRELQVRAFELVCSSAARLGGKVLSIHAVRSAGAVLDVLERTGALASCTCVMHWFSGTSDDLVRARRLGCYFSVNPRMLATRRGRAYAHAIEAGRLLLESDLPAHPGSPQDPCEMARALRSALAWLEEDRGHSLADAMNETCVHVFERAGYDATALIRAARRP